jgi:RNA polymerase sigma-70 factor (ECF subfamily)
MMRIATDFFHNEEDAEDIVQEVYVRMLKRGWQQGDELENLLIRATKNLCVSVWRRQKLRETEQLEDIREPEACHSADTSLIQEERQESLEVAILRLPPSEQRLIRMKGDELSLDEISTQTGIPKRTVSVMLSTARKRLLNILETKNYDR